MNIELLKDRKLIFLKQILAKAFVEIVELT